MEINEPGVAPSRGLLNRQESMRRLDLIRIAPASDIADLVENYWLVRWDLIGFDDYVQENLPHPSVNMVVDPQIESGIWGVQTGKWVYRISGRGAVFGTKFHPGGFSGLFGGPVRAITDKRVPIGSIFGIADDELEASFAEMNAEEQFGARMDQMIRAKRRPLSAGAIRARTIVEAIDKDADLMTVAKVARQAGLSPRSLQRLFETHVGVGPKWVIDRFRMLSAVEALNRGEAVGLTGLAHELGYFDQAHFAHRFAALTGMSPSRYQALSFATRP